MTDTPEEEPEFDLNAAAQEMQHLSRINEEGVKTLAGRGKAIPMGARRVEFFIDAMFGPWGESVERLQFELSWQRRLQHLLGEALVETAGQSLIVPKSNGGSGNGLHLP